MSDEVPPPVQRAAVQAQLQINDLGNANRNHVFTFDPTHREVRLHRVLAVRDCNDETTEAYRLAAANRPKINAWSNPTNLGDPAVQDSDGDDNNLDGRPAHGQSHRVKLQREARAGNLEQDTEPLPPPRSNKNGKYHPGATNSAPHPATPHRSGNPSRDPARDPARNSSGGRHPASRNTQGQQANRSLLQPKSRSTGPNSNVPPQNMVAQTRGLTQLSPSRAPPKPLRAQLTPPTPGPVSKKRPVDSTLTPVAESSQKRTYKYTSESTPKKHDRRPSAPNRDTSRAVETKFYQNGPKPARKPQTLAGQGSRPATLTTTSEQPFKVRAWTGPLEENPVAVLSATSPANLSTEAQMRENPVTARFFKSEPSSKPPIQPRSAARPTTPQDLVCEVPDVMDSEFNRKELEELSASFAALEVTPRPPTPIVSRPGLTASIYATTVTPPDSVTSTTPAESQISRVYESAMSSEAAFWKWKAAQKPNRSGF